MESKQEQFREIGFNIPGACILLTVDLNPGGSWDDDAWKELSRAVDKFKVNYQRSSDV